VVVRRRRPAVNRRQIIVRGDNDKNDNSRRIKNASIFKFVEWFLVAKWMLSILWSTRE